MQGTERFDCSAVLRLRVNLLILKINPLKSKMTEQINNCYFFFAACCIELGESLFQLVDSFDAIIKLTLILLGGFLITCRVITECFFVQILLLHRYVLHPRVRVHTEVSHTLWEYNNMTDVEELPKSHYQIDTCFFYISIISSSKNGNLITTDREYWICRGFSLKLTWKYFWASRKAENLPWFNRFAVLRLLGR